jgi:subtilisin-like proprotein convertase family protein
MDAHSSLKWIISLFFVLVSCSSAVFAGPTFIYGGDFNLPILDKQDSGSSMVEAIIKVPDHLTIYDLDVGINVTHTNVFDLQIFVISPHDTRLCLNMYDFKNEFFKGEGYVQTIFDDEAEKPIEQGTAPFTGRFRPKTGSLLEIFDGEDTYGFWRLQVDDVWYWDTGNLERFELIVTVCEPSTLSLLALGAGLTVLFRLRQA